MANPAIKVEDLMEPYLPIFFFSVYSYLLTRQPARYLLYIQRKINDLSWKILIFRTLISCKSVSFLMQQHHSFLLRSNELLSWVYLSCVFPIALVGFFGLLMCALLEHGRNERFQYISQIVASHIIFVCYVLYEGQSSPFYFFVNFSITLSAFSVFCYWHVSSDIMLCLNLYLMTMWNHLTQALFISSVFLAAIMVYVSTSSN